jgi:hypothetical protein
LDNEFRKISETIYLDKSLESLPISIMSKSNDLYKISIDSLDHNEVFKNKLNDLGISVLEANNLIANYNKDETDVNLTVKDIKNSIVEYYTDKITDNDLSSIEVFFDTYEFIQCTTIELQFNNYHNFYEPVLFYKDEINKELLFSDELILIDVLCEEFEINNTEKINIRKKLNKKRLSSGREFQNDVNENTNNEYQSKEFSLIEIETLKKIIGGDLTEELTSQKEANFSASLKGILQLDSIGFLPKNQEEFRETNVKSFQNDEGEERKIIFRSSVKGLLYLDPYSWKQLETEKVELWVYLGHDNFKIIYSKMDLINMPYNPYTLLRIDNTIKDIELVNKLMENAPISSTKLLFITNQEMAEKLNTDIFNNENNPVTKSSNITDEIYL